MRAAIALLALMGVQSTTGQITGMTPTTGIDPTTSGMIPSSTTGMDPTTSGRIPSSTTGMDPTTSGRIPSSTTGMDPTTSGMIPSSTTGMDPTTTGMIPSTGGAPIPGGATQPAAACMTPGGPYEICGITAGGQPDLSKLCSDTCRAQATTCPSINQMLPVCSAPPGSLPGASTGGTSGSAMPAECVEPLKVCGAGGGGAPDVQKLCSDTCKAEESKCSYIAQIRATGCSGAGGIPTTSGMVPTTSGMDPTTSGMIPTTSGTVPTSGGAAGGGPGPECIEPLKACGYSAGGGAPDITKMCGTACAAGESKCSYISMLRKQACSKQGVTGGAPMPATTGGAPMPATTGGAPMPATTGGAPRPPMPAPQPGGTPALPGAPMTGGLKPHNTIKHPISVVPKPAAEVCAAATGGAADGKCDKTFFQTAAKCQNTTGCWTTAMLNATVGMKNCMSCLCSKGDIRVCADASLTPKGSCGAGDMGAMMSIASCQDGTTGDACRTQKLMELGDDCMTCFMAGGKECLSTVPHKMGSCQPRDMMRFASLSTCANDEACLQKAMSGVAGEAKDCVDCIMSMAIGAAMGDGSGDGSWGGSGSSDPYAAGVKKCMANNGFDQLKGTCTMRDFTNMAGINDRCSTQQNSDNCMMEGIDMDMTGASDKVNANCFTCMAMGAGLMGGSGSGSGFGSGSDDAKSKMRQCAVKGIKCAKKDIDLAQQVFAGCFTNGKLDIQCVSSNPSTASINSDCEGCLNIQDCPGSSEDEAFWKCALKACTPEQKSKKLVKGLLKLKRTKAIKEECKEKDCKKEAKVLAQSLLASLKQKLGDANVEKVAVTHLCDIVKSQKEPTEADKKDPNICHDVGTQEAASLRRAHRLAGCTSDADCQRVGVYSVTTTEDGKTIESNVDSIAQSGSAPAQLEGSVSGSSTTEDLSGGDDDDGGMGGGAVVGIIAAVLAVCGVGILVAVLVKNRKQGAKFQGGQPLQG
eukprot:TRINITY_DN656_c0_g1_i17.p1 TRINITY_DN656_c0_g1~~TRINITY_DN656_c0_g1_i17.p1  ORF type:complete len:975 (+),score=263.46 TRINITY_DN656_c0_g1_i17:105-3029(+)